MEISCLITDHQIRKQLWKELRSRSCPSNSPPLPKELEGTPGVEGDGGDPGRVALAPGHYLPIRHAVHAQQVVLPRRRQVPPVWAEGAAQQPAVVALRQSRAGFRQDLWCTTLE